MATKYRREGFRSSAAGTHGLTRRDVRGTLDPKRRLLVIYSGLLLFVVLMLVYHALGLQGALDLQPETQADGTVTAKRATPEPNARFFVTVEVPDAGRDEDTGARIPLREEIQVPQDSYDAVEVGAILTVTYQPNHNETAIVIRNLQAEPRPTETVLNVDYQDPPPQPATP